MIVDRLNDEQAVHVWDYYEKRQKPLPLDLWTRLVSMGFIVT